MELVLVQTDAHVVSPALDDVSEETPAARQHSQLPPAASTPTATNLLPARRVEVTFITKHFQLCSYEEFAKKSKV